MKNLFDEKDELVLCKDIPIVLMKLGGGLSLHC